MRTRRNGARQDERTTTKTPETQTGARKTDLEDEVPARKTLRKRPLVEEKKTKTKPSVTKKRVRFATEDAPTASTVPERRPTKKTPEKHQTGARKTAINLEDEVPAWKILRKRPLVGEKQKTSETKPSVTKKRTRPTITEDAPTVSTVPTRRPESSPVGFARGLAPEKIVGITRVDGNRTFLIKWIGSNETDLVPSVEANLLCPQHVIDFYQDLAKRNNPAGNIHICMPTNWNVRRPRSVRIARRKNQNQKGLV